MIQAWPIDKIRTINVLDIQYSLAYGYLANRYSVKPWHRQVDGRKSVTGYSYISNRPVSN